MTKWTNRVFVRHGIPALLLVLGMSAAALAQNSQTTISVDANANQHPINPNIYGLNWASPNEMTGLNATLDRLGGNTGSRYNWQLDAHSSAGDWYFETFADSSGTQAASMDGHISDARSNPGAEPMLTIPMLDWLANLGPNRSTLWGFSVSKYGTQTATDPYRPDAGNGVSSATNQSITGNDPRDTGTPNSPAIQQGYVQHLVSKYGPSTTSTGIKYYMLDNEPSIWNGTQRDVHPTHSTYDELLSKTEAYIQAIRAADPNAKVVGFEDWTWVAMFQSSLDQEVGLPAAQSDFNMHNAERPCQDSDIAKRLDTQPATLAMTRRPSRVVWMGATVRNLVGLGEMPEKGAPMETAVIVEIVPPRSAAAHAGLQPGDLLLEVNGAPVASTDQLQSFTNACHSGQPWELKGLRDQHRIELLLECSVW